MKIQKKLLSFLLCFVLLSTAPMAYAADTEVYTDNYFQYTVENGSITIVNYYGMDSEVTVPASIGQYPVNVIAAGAFTSCENVTKINLPDCIMTVEQGAFAGTQTIVFDSNTDEPIAREPEVERQQQEESEAQNPVQNEVNAPVTNQPEPTAKEENPNEAIVNVDEDDDGNVVVTPVTPTDGSNAPSGNNDPSQQGNPANPEVGGKDAAKSGMPWYGIAAIVVGVVALAGGGYFLWRKKHGAN